MEDRLKTVMDRIAAACGRAGRNPDSVRLVAVSKTFPPESIREAADSGIALFGESKVQEARAKIPLCPGGLEWHMVGHLQRNKVRDAVELFRMIHSVDSLRLLETIDAASSESGVTMPVLLEINVSGESSKFGMPPGEVATVLEKAGNLMNVDVLGLMTVPPFAEDPEKARPYFRKLRELRDDMRQQTGVPLSELSMGMSHDFEVAIEEGATLVRVGSALFGDRPAKKDVDTGVADG